MTVSASVSAVAADEKAVADEAAVAAMDVRGGGGREMRMKMR